MQPLRIYIAGPYSGNTREAIQQNVNRAIDAGMAILKKGHHPYVPHLTDLVDQRARENGTPMSWEEFMQWDTPWLEASDALLYLASSRGANIELEEATRMGKTIFRSLEEIPAVQKPRTKSQIVREVAVRRGIQVEDTSSETQPQADA